MRYAGSCARSCATSRGTAAHERHGLRPCAGDTSAITVIEQDRKEEPPERSAGGAVDEAGDGRPAASPPRIHIVEVRDDVPGDERVLRSLLDPVEKLQGRVRMGTPVERQIDESVRVQKRQRYFRASAS